MLSMVFEVIQPDLEINRRHTATLLIPPTGRSVGAASGSSVEGFGRILAVALRRNPPRRQISNEAVEDPQPFQQSSTRLRRKRASLKHIAKARRCAVHQTAVTAARAGFNARASSGPALAARKSIANQALELITASTAPMKNAACQ